MASPWNSEMLRVQCTGTVLGGVTSLSGYGAVLVLLVCPGSSRVHDWSHIWFGLTATKAMKQLGNCMW
eukprot:jgi/Botrbrau1/21447/Bobra.0216s0055.1